VNGQKRSFFLLVSTLAFSLPLSLNNEYRFYSAHLSAGRKVPSFKADSILPPIIYDIYTLGDDILDIMENAGGHTIARHVTKSYAYLQERAATMKKGIATSFMSKKIAVAAVKDSLKKNSKKIYAWLTVLPQKRIVLQCSHDYPVGYGVYKNHHALCTNLHCSKMVMDKNGEQSLGFVIITAYPIVM
jgi:hypothetical protein